MPCPRGIVPSQRSLPTHPAFVKGQRQEPMALANGVPLWPWGLGWGPMSPSKPRAIGPWRSQGPIPGPPRTGMGVAKCLPHRGLQCPERPLAPGCRTHRIDWLPEARPSVREAHGGPYPALCQGLIEVLPSAGR